jgi:sec-independent protein translocase protein TatA
MGIESPVHLIFIAAVALIVLGPKRLPRLARALGEGIREFRGAIEQAGTPPAELAQPAAPAEPAEPSSVAASPAPAQAVTSPPQPEVAQPKVAQPKAAQPHAAVAEEAPDPPAPSGPGGPA